MLYIISLTGFAQIAFGVFAIFVGKSAMTETTAAVCIGLGTLALAMVEVLQRMDKKAVTTKPTPSTSGDLITMHRMYDIRRNADGLFTTAGNSFADLEAAKTFIDKRYKAEN